MGGVNLGKKAVKFWMHGSFEPVSHRIIKDNILNRIIKDNVLITYMKFYENNMATLVAMATIYENIQITFPMKLLRQY